ncbi:MAG: CHAT domain-containing protein, partial [Ignavibacteriaceae bacterium]
MDYLINQYEISYYFSASTLNDISQNKNDYNKNFAGFAPVFSNDSETKKNIALVIDTTIIRSINVEGKDYASLPETEHEIRKISELFQNKNIPSKMFLNSSANEKAIKSSSMKNYEIVHIASHGFLNEKSPKLTGILFWNDKNDPNEDGVLYSGEIYNLTLNAELLVLSACETGLGKIVRGEGLIGLTRGFTYAGAENILVSLWQVADKSTSELMIEFYRNILLG